MSFNMQKKKKHLLSEKPSHSSSYSC